MWQYNADLTVQWARGVYLICNNGYLGWPESIRPYHGEPSSTLEGYFSSKLERVQKDVECIWNIEEEVEHTLLKVGVSRHKVCKKIDHMQLPAQLLGQ